MNQFAETCDAHVPVHTRPHRNRRNPRMSRKRFTLLFGPLHVVFHSLYLQPCFVRLKQWYQGRIKGERQRGGMCRLRCNKMRSRDLKKKKGGWRLGILQEHWSL